MRRALIINPESRMDSFWDHRDTCALVGARYPAPPLGLCTIAALLPPDWELKLLDSNTERWDGALLDWADIVLTGGMFPQRAACLELIREARKRGKTVIVGGPDPSAVPQLYQESSHLVLGEAEVTLPKYLDDLNAGRAARVYRPGCLAELAQAPVPRFDLLKFRLYSYMDLQYSRGCPFLCEFCDIPDLHGRVPRLKSPLQVLAELGSLYDLGYRGHIHIVDDNFIGNRRTVKQMLPSLTTWLAVRHWPFEFSAAVSIDVADDEGLLQAMKQAGFFGVFIGIESVQEATLLTMRKEQNLQRSVVERIRAIHRHGMWVITSYILGADGETDAAAADILHCIEATAIPVNQVGLMFAMPNAPLTRRLRNEGRLPKDYDSAVDYDGDHCTVGLNFEPRRPRVDILRDYLRVIEAIYAPGAYFARVRKMATVLDCSGRKYRPALTRCLLEFRAFLRMAKRFGGRRDTRGPFWRTVMWTLLRNPRAIRYIGSLCALYLHLGPFAESVASRIRTSLEPGPRARALIRS